MTKKLFYGDDARQRVLGGAQMLYDAVKVTYGPKGGNVLIQKPYGGPSVTHDGVTVAEAVEIADIDDETLGYKQGAELIKTAAKNLNLAAGDGTSTVTILTYHILKEANRMIAAGTNAQELRAGIEAAGRDVLAGLKDLAEEIDPKSEKVADIATISAGSREIGEIIAKVISQVGKDGVVTVETSQGLEMESELVEGYTVDRGFASPYFITDTSKQTAVLENPMILITDKRIDSTLELLPILEKMNQSGKKDLVIIAEDVGPETLSALILNKIKGAFNSVIIKAPSYGERRKAVLEDIAILTGGQLIGEDLGHKFDTVDLEMLGTARKVIVGQNESTIISGAGDPSERIKELKAQTKTATGYDLETINSRAAALEGKVAIIRVGGATETEIEEKKFRVDDAVAASKAALSEGIVAGGGVTLVNLAHKLPDTTDGHKLLKAALQQPFLILMENSGINGQAHIAAVQEATGQGINVQDPSKGMIDVKTAGIIDPVRVTRESIQNAVSIAATASTMGAMVVDIPGADKDA